MNGEHQGSSDTGKGDADPRDPGRPGFADRPARDSDLRGDAGFDARPGVAPDEVDLPGYEQVDGVDPRVAEQLAALVLAQINQHQHIHLSEQMPNADQLAELKAKAPEAYSMWIETTRKRNDHEIWQSRKAVRQPYLLASLGQWLGLVAVLSVLVLAGYAVHQGSAVLAGILGVVDIIGLAAVFNGNQGRRRDRKE